MFGKVNKTTGDVSEIAGLGELVPSVSLYQKGSVNFSCGPDQWTTVDITLNTPMPDEEYVVVMDSAQTAYVHVQNVTYKTRTGFTAIIYNRDALSGTGIINWQAFKLMTDQQTALDEAQITKNKNNTATTFSTSTSYAVGSYCINNGNLYRCTTAHSGAWNASHFTATNVTNAIARYNDAISIPGYFSAALLADVKTSADAVANYKQFQGGSQSGAEASWFGFKKTSTYWHCTMWDGNGVVTHLVYKNGTYTCNVIHEGVSNE